MKNSNYRIITKNIEDHHYIFIEQKVKYFFGLLHFWDLLELGKNFTTEAEAKRFLKQLEFNKSKLMIKGNETHFTYYDIKNDEYFEK